MEKLPKEYFYAVFELARRYEEYDSYRRSNGRPGPVGQLFHKERRNPLPDGEHKLYSVMPEAFAAAFPEATAYKVGPYGPADNSACCSLRYGGYGKIYLSYNCEDSTGRTHSERFSFNNNYGVPNIYREIIPEEYSRRGRTPRFESPFFKKQNGVIDSICVEFTRGGGLDSMKHCSNRELRNYMKKTEEYLERIHLEDRLLKEKVKADCPDPKDPVSYIRSRQMKESVYDGLKAGTIRNDAYVRELFERSSYALAYRRCNLVDDLSRRMVPVVDASSMMPYARRVFEHSSLLALDTTSNKRKLLMTFASVAKENGMTRKLVEEEIKKYAGSWDVKLSPKDWSVIRDRMSDVEEKICDAFDHYVRVNSVSGKSPEVLVDGFLKEYQKDRQRDFARHTGIKDAVNHVMKGSVGVSGKDDRLSASVTGDVTSAPEKDLSSVKDNAVSLDSQMSAVFGRDFKQYAAGVDMVSVYDCCLFVPDDNGMGRGSVPVTALAQDMTAAALVLSGGDTDRLGTFLREIGFRPGKDVDMAEQFFGCANKMYGNGSVKKVEAVNSFRERYHDEIKAGRQMVKGLRRSRTQDRSVKLSKGLTL